MTASTVPPGDARNTPSRLAGWIRAKDPQLTAVKRSVRAAVVMPVVFGLTHLLFSDPQVSLFGAFGSFALLLLVDFPGRPRTRLVSYVGLFVVGSCFIALGTVVSTDKVGAVVAMAVVGFAVLFGGIVAPQVATASTAALLTFVLPVAVAQPAASTGARLFGWLVAAAFCIPACLVVWPTPWHDDLRRRLSATLSAVSRMAAMVADGRPVPEAQDAVASELTLLRSHYAATPYPPTGAAAGAVALAKLVGRVEWMAGNAALVNGDTVPIELPRIRTIIEVVAETLDECARLICDGNAYPVEDDVLVGAIRESTARLDGLVGSELDAEVSMLIDTGADVTAGSLSDVVGPGGSGREGMAPALDPSFRARALGIAAEMVADATLESAGAQPDGDRRLGVVEGPSRQMVWSRLVSHLSFRSVWFRNALRGAFGLALAVAVVEITDVGHGFWVVLGTLSVLRSNALGTGATALRAIGGTAVGFVIGSAIMIGVADHTALLWALLPLAVLVSGVAPSMISFAAGQAGFTLVVIILFNIIDPVGWKVGLTRIEDVAIGCGVSIVVGLLFWPRGATAALGRALSDAFVTNSGYLADAVDRLTTSTRQVDTGPGQRAAHLAYLRLDDAFRQFLAERGAKVVPVDTIADLFTGSNRLRLAAYTLATLPAFPTGPDRPELESVAVAGAVLRDAYASSHRWYGEFAELLADRRASLDPPPGRDEVLQDVLREAFVDASNRRRGDRLRTALQMLWADELLENQRQVQVDLVASADRFARQRRQGLLV
jgi:hypothetical protein